MSNNNKQLPVEVVRQIEQEAHDAASALYSPNNYNEFTCFQSGYQKGATEYATKLLQVEKERDELRRWKIETVEQMLPIGAYCHKYLEVNLGDNSTDLVIAELHRLRGDNEQLKERAEKIRLALVMAVFALKLSYDVIEHPADGKTNQDSAIRIGEEALNAWNEGKETPTQPTGPCANSSGCTDWGACEKLNGCKMKEGKDA